MVDEINQGMDASYEKSVFEFIVQLNCHADAPQCFLITPKLQSEILRGVDQHICVLQVFKGRGLGGIENGRF